MPRGGCSPCDVGRLPRATRLAQRHRLRDHGAAEEQRWHRSAEEGRSRCGEGQGRLARRHRLQAGSASEWPTRDSWATRLPGGQRETRATPGRRRSSCGAATSRWTLGNWARGKCRVRRASAPSAAALADVRGSSERRVSCGQQTVPDRTRRHAERLEREHEQLFANLAPLEHLGRLCRTVSGNI